METTEGNYVFLSSSILIGVVFGGAVFVLMYILKVMKSDQKITETEVKNDKDFEHINARKDTSAIGKKKKNIESRWTNRTDKQGYSHSWLLTSLKGHTGQVLDMDYASNGKYLASCADEEPDPGDDVGSGDMGSSSGSECNKENNRPLSAEPCPRAKPLSRRQRKNRRREDGSSPESKKKSKAKKSPAAPPAPTNESSENAENQGEEVSHKNSHEPLANYTKLAALSDASRRNRLFHTYLLSPEQMLTLGYPVECASHPGRAVIFKSDAEVSCYPKTAYKYNKFESKSGFDVNAREFVPNLYRHQNNVASIGGDEHSSGHDSGNSSDSGENDSESSDGYAPIEKPTAIIRTFQQVFVNNPGRNPCVYPQPSLYVKYETVSYARPMCPPDILQRACSRCSAEFYMHSDYSYITQEPCFYHWGKMTRNNGISSGFLCCGGKQDSRGCTKAKLHVWNGLVYGFNGPYTNYVRTQRKKMPPVGHHGIYALDCEMVFTNHGLELAKVTVITETGRVVYDVYVKLENEVIDYNSRFSGITAKSMQKMRHSLKTIREVQSDLTSFIDAETILVGHGLENDLRALRIMHTTCIDTAVAFPHWNGLPYRRSLKSLAFCILKREIQTGSNGHNSTEDATACMDLMLWRVWKDFRSILLLGDSYHF